MFRNLFNHDNSVPQTEIATVKPKNLKDAEKIIDFLQENISVVVNFEETQENEIRHIIDFIQGKTYGVATAPEKISEKIFIFTPNNVTIEAVDKKKKFW